MERMGHGSQRSALIYLHATTDGHRVIAEGITPAMSEDTAGGDDDDGPAGALVPA